MDLSLIILIVVAVLIAVTTLLLVGRNAPTQAPPAEPAQGDSHVEAPEVLVEAPQAAIEVQEPTAEQLEEPAIPEPTVEAIATPIPAEVTPAPSLASRLRLGLQKTRGALGQKIASFAGRDNLDEEAWEEIEEALIRADVGVKATTRIVEHLRDKKVAPADLRSALEEELIATLSKNASPLNIGEGTNVWLVTGVNGVGKTTSIAKLGHRLIEQGHSVVLVAADTFRAAAIDQLGTWAERAGIHMVKHAPGADPGAVVFDAIQHAKAKGIDVVIVDTAGRLHTASNLMEELKKVRRVAEREAGGVAESLLVLDATVGQNGLAQAKTFQEAIEISGVILTKLDGTARGGIVVAIQEELKIPVKAVGLGESMDDLETFDPKRFVEALLEDV